MQGWGVVRFILFREEATHITVTLGAVYLCYSAFFVTIEISTLNTVVRYTIGIVYLMLAYLIYVNIKKNIEILNQHIHHSGNVVEIPLLNEALELKKQMLM